MDIKTKKIYNEDIDLMEEDKERVIKLMFDLASYYPEISK